MQHQPLDYPAQVEVASGLSVVSKAIEAQLGEKCLAIGREAQPSNP